MSLEEIKNLPYKEALLLRQIRVDRLNEQNAIAEAERKSEEDKQKREAARNKILLPN